MSKDAISRSEWEGLTGEHTGPGDPDILKRLADFEAHELHASNPYGAEVLHRAGEEIRRLRGKTLPSWTGMQIMTCDFLPRGYIWLHSETEKGDPARDEVNSIIKGITDGND